MNRIREVWATNLDMEMAALRETIDRYPYIALTTELPGTVARPIGNFKTATDYSFQTMRCNVELLKVIQIGLTLCDGEGNYAPEPCTWQFNFRFSLNEDMYAADVVDTLMKSNVDFQRHEEQGIVPDEFAELMITSGLVLSDDTKWLAYASQNDFGYLLKALTAAPLPSTENEFQNLLSMWFPTLFDLKYIVKSMKSTTKGGLQELADELQVPRNAPAHQAGSDSLLMAATFFKVQELVFGNNMDEAKYNGHVSNADANISYTIPTHATSPVIVSHDRAHQQSLHAQQVHSQQLSQASLHQQNQLHAAQQQALHQSHAGLHSAGPGMHTPGIYPAPGNMGAYLGYGR